MNRLYFHSRHYDLTHVHCMHALQRRPIPPYRHIPSQRWCKYAEVRHTIFLTGTLMTRALFHLITGGRPKIKAKVTFHCSVFYVQSFSIIMCTCKYYLAVLAGYCVLVYCRQLSFWSQHYAAVSHVEHSYWSTRKFLHLWVGQLCYLISTLVEWVYNS